MSNDVLHVIMVRTPRAPCIISILQILSIIDIQKPYFIARNVYVLTLKWIGHLIV